ncbi:MAG: serine/threonine-protein kinase [Holophaga sp.]|nr:serine/threonine-protein kinase [Holophaga sp.]
MSSDPHQLQPAWLNAQSPREGRYVIGPILGRGGMGDVHEAWDVVLCRTVALKILKDIEPAALIRFMHEAQIHARVVHPNICRIYDVDNYEGSLRVAMQLVRGSNLEQICGELSQREIVTIMAQVAQAVHVVHRLNLVHRDLKPSNILLERNAEGKWTPFVCDFGLAMALDEPALTYTHGVIGTPAYMAPEQLQGKRERISPATDVYALGGTLHFALTGHPPSGSRRNQDTGSLPAIPRDLRVIIAKCLEEEPELRYASASTLAEDLWRVRDGTPILASSPSSLVRLGHWSRMGIRQTRPWLTALAIALLVVVGAQFIFAHRQAVNRQQMELAQRLDLEAGDLAREFRLELMLPVHDLRPSYARIRARLERDRARMLGQAPEWQGSGHFALGTGHYLVREFAAAQGELEQAWASGFQDPAVTSLLGWATLPAARTAELSAQFDPQLPAPASASVPMTEQVQGILHQARNQEPSQVDEAVVACLAKDYLRGAAIGHAAFLAMPWHYEAATLEATCLTGLARQEQEAGHLAKAELRYQQAMGAAKGALAVGQSDPASYHAFFLAARGLAALTLEWGDSPRPSLGEMQTACNLALRLDPTDPDLQDDWLALHSLQARRLALYGQDPEPELKAARSFLDIWCREPLSPALRADRMLIYGHMAQREFQRGGDPGPALDEALKNAGHTPFLWRDYYWEWMNLKAQVEAARGRDPRPTLAAALDRLQPLAQGGPWSLKETLADSWLIRAQWEAAHGVDPGASVAQARALAESARSQNPDSASPYALEGLCLVLELQALPGQRARLLAQAQERLQQALARCPRGPRQARLLRALQEAK